MARQRERLQRESRRLVGGEGYVRVGTAYGENGIEGLSVGRPR